MTKSVFFIVGVIIVGALIGSTVGALVGEVLPGGAVKDIFQKEIVAGFQQPIQFDLRIVSFTFGCQVKLNFMSIVGMVIAAFLFKFISP